MQNPIQFDQNFFVPMLAEKMPLSCPKWHIDPDLHYHTDTRKEVSFSFKDHPHLIFRYFSKEKDLALAEKNITSVKTFCQVEKLDLITVPQTKTVLVQTAQKTYKLLVVLIDKDEEIQTRPKLSLDKRFNDRLPFYRHRYQAAMEQISRLILEFGYHGEIDLIGQKTNQSEPQWTLPRIVLLTPDKLSKKESKEHFWRFYLPSSTLESRKYLSSKGFSEAAIKEFLTDQEDEKEFEQEVKAFYTKNGVQKAAQPIDQIHGPLLANEEELNWDPQMFGHRKTLKNPLLKRMYFEYTANVLIARINRALQKNNQRWEQRGDTNLATFQKIRVVSISISDFNLYYKHDCYLPDEKSVHHNILNSVVDRMIRKGYIFKKFNVRLQGEELHLQC